MFNLQYTQLSNNIKSLFERLRNLSLDGGTFTGNVTGNVTGNTTGDLLGDVTGNVTGDVTGNVTGNINGEVNSTLLQIPEKTPINAVAAANTLTVSGVPADNATVTLGDQVYTFENAITPTGVAASNTLTFTNVPLATETVTVNTETYKYVAALTERYATGALTYSGTVDFGETVAISGREYEMTDGAVPPVGDVAIDISGGTKTQATAKLTFAGAVENGEIFMVGADTCEIILDGGTATPGNIEIDLTASPTAARAVGELTIVNPVLDGETVTIGTDVYEFDADSSVTPGNIAVDISAETKTQAHGELTISGDVIEGETFTVGTETYEFSGSGNITPGNILIDVSGTMVASQGMLTLGAIPDNRDTMTIGYVGTEVTYTWVTALTSPAVPNEILRGLTVDDCVDYFTYAINHGVGEGTFYSTGTVANPAIVASKVSGTEATLTSKIWGTIGDTVVTTDTFTDGANTFNDVTLGTTTAGVDCIKADAKTAAIADYAGAWVTASDGGGDIIDFDVNVGSPADGSLGNSIATTSVMANGAFADVTLLGGTDATGQEAADVLAPIIAANPTSVVDATAGVNKVEVAAFIAGADYNTVGTTETMSDVANVWANVTLINGAGATGAEAEAQIIIDYNAGTTLDITATADLGADAVDFTCDAAGALDGSAGNAITTTTTITNAAWGGANLTGGTDATLAEAAVATILAISGDGAADVSAAAGGAGVVNMTALVLGVAGNAITTTTTCANGAFGAGTLSGGVDAIPNEVLIGSVERSIDYLVAANMGGLGEGTAYATGTTHQSAGATGVTCTKASATEFYVEANSIGDWGNAIPVAETLTDASWDSGHTTELYGGEDPEGAYDVLLGATAEECIDNLVAAITYDNGTGANEGILYGTGTVANTKATAVKATAATMTATNLIKGVIGNSTDVGETDAQLEWTGGSTTKLLGGVNGTVGVVNETCADGTYLYHAIAANTIADANWRRITLNSF